MNKQETIEYIELSEKRAKKTNIDRIKTLMQLLGNPEKGLKFVHVTGSNGKGSTCAMIANVLQTAGYKTGLFTSPHLMEYNERIRLNGIDISDEDLAYYAEIVKKAAKNMQEIPAVFEKLFAIAMLYYKDQKPDIVVLEVGIGGRLDTTNVIEPPEVCVITNIGLEHTKYLGDTVEKIAFEKAGIIKTGCDAVVYDSTPGVVEVVKNVCKERNVPLSVVDFSAIYAREQSLYGQIFDYKRFSSIKLPLLGNHQLKNAATVIESLLALQNRGWNISDEDILKGIETSNWAARFEVLSYEPLFILDGGHNPQCIESLVENLKAYLPNQKISFIFGVMADKDYEKELALVMPFAKRFICVTPPSNRALNADDLALHIKNLGCEAYGVSEIEKAVHFANSFKDSPVVAFGSLYISGEIRKVFGK